MQRRYRLRQLANDVVQVQTATPSGGTKWANPVWEDGPLFASEREAELWARSKIDAARGAVLNDPRSPGGYAGHSCANWLVTKPIPGSMGKARQVG